MGNDMERTYDVKFGTWSLVIEQLRFYFIKSCTLYQNDAKFMIYINGKLWSQICLFYFRIDRSLSILHSKRISKHDKQQKWEFVTCVTLWNIWPLIYSSHIMGRMRSNKFLQLCPLMYILLLYVRAHIFQHMMFMIVLWYVKQHWVMRKH